MTLWQQVLTIAAVVLGTMTTRFLPFLLFPEGKQPPLVNDPGPGFGCGGGAALPGAGDPV